MTTGKTKGMKSGAPGGRFRRIGSRAAVLAALVTMAVLVLIVVGYVAWSNLQGFSAVYPPDLADKLEGYKTQASSIESLLALLVTFSSLYALALGAFSYVSANDSAKRIDDLRERLEKQFPFFMRMGERMESLKKRLEELMPDSDEQDDYYQRLTDVDRERMETVEQSAVAWLYFLDFGSDEKTAGLASDIYRNLGKFYRARYAAEKERLRNEGCADDELRRGALLALKSRAMLFLTSAKEKNPDSFLACNDLANFQMDIEGWTSQAAEDCFRTSLRLQRRQQRAWYNLAIIVYSRAKEDLKRYRIREATDGFAEAERLCAEALRHRQWQLEENAERTQDVIYNLACYRSRLESLASTEADRKRWADQTEDDLRRISTSKDAKRLKLLLGDIEGDGDLVWFSQRRASAIALIRAKLEGSR